MPSDAQAAVAIGEQVATKLESDGRETALRHAMRAVEPLLEAPSDSLRIDLRKNVFKKFSKLKVSYQGNDFESVDYQLYELVPDLPLFRGPPVPPAALRRGEYFCVLGAAQTFGRLVREPWPTLLGDAIGRPVLNMSQAGAGPELFLTPALLTLIRNARFVIVQVMSGRSVGCEDYPGGRRIKGVAEYENMNRWDILERLWKADRNVALDYVRRWNKNYLELYRRLRSQIRRPALLLWLSSRRPADWRPKRLLRELNWGDFPQLVGLGLFESMAVLFDERLEHITGKSTVRPVSRVTGEPCPYFGSGKALHTEMHYYPSAANHAALAEALTPWARGALSKAFQAAPTKRQSATEPPVRLFG